MVGTSKILTVSYGTFSCTLEGFDDSFGTMKDIAEYFRDLAADDRYFGAEPPSPDAETLARIAQGRTRAPVAARIEESGVVLSPEGRAPAAYTGSRLDRLRRLVEAETVGDGYDEDAPASLRAGPMEPQHVAGRLDTGPAILDGATETEAEAEAEEETLGDLDAREAERSNVVALSPGAEAEQVAPEEVQPLEEVLSAADELDETPEAPEAEDPAAPDAQERAALDDAGWDAPMEALDDAPDGPIEDETAMPEVAAAPELPELEGEDEPADAPVAEALTPGDDHEIAGLAELDLPEEPAAEATPDEDMDVDVPSSGDDELVAKMDERPEDVEGDEDPATAEGPGDGEEADPLGAFLDDLGEPRGDESAEHDAAARAEEDEAEGPEAAEAEAPAGPVVPRRPGIRVAKIKRSDLEAAIKTGALVAEDAPGEAPRGGSLSDEQEAELMAELAELESDDDDGPAAQDDAPAPEETATPPAPGNALDRLLQATNSRLEAPETARRRSAIQRLRHAVKATVAEGGRRRKEKDGAPYRDDLDHAMRGERKPAPLKLVATQRVDAAEDAAQDAPVAPRRPVRLTEVTSGEGSGGFAAVVAARGLREMDDVLEAAAAHATQEAGEPAPRRAIMSLAAEGAPDLDWSRENGLRAFGRLLREGRIVKLERGRYAPAEASRYAS